VKAAPADRAAVCRRMRSEDRVALAVHDKPDTDALGAAAGMLDLFSQLRVEARLYVADGELLPLETYLLPAGSVERGVPQAGTPLYVLDCGTLSRLALPIESWEGFVVNVDHHQDNSRFGDLVLVIPDASSTSEIVCDIARGLGLEPQPRTATALYAGISFDTGHFRHGSTSADTFACASWLVGLGVDVTDVHEELYERRTPGALRLWARAVSSAATLAGGRAMVSTLTLGDYAAAGAGTDETQGIVESLRTVAGVEVAAIVKEQEHGARVRASLRSSTLDVSAVAALSGGGGHRLAAGFSSDQSPEEVTAWLSSELERRLKTASS
jgi:phosphoesterase RecJ-like protein